MHNSKVEIHVIFILEFHITTGQRFLFYMPRIICQHEILFRTANGNRELDFVKIKNMSVQQQEQTTLFTSGISKVKHVSKS